MVRFAQRSGAELPFVRVRRSVRTQGADSEPRVLRPAASFMLAYISGALLNAAQLDKSRALYERFAQACRDAGWDAYVPHQHADPVRDAHLSNTEVAERDLENVTAADVLVAYVGEPSLGVGAEVAIALRAGKRILLVAESDRRVSRFLLGLAELHPSQTAVCRYQTADEAAAWITAELDRLIGAPGLQTRGN